MSRVALILSLLLFICVSLFGCAGELKYTRPTLTQEIKNSVTVKKSKEQVWKELIPKIGKNFFVINNLDKDSGIINISYSGDPQRYIDCGEIYSYVKNARGERTYQFPASKGYQEYEAMENGILSFAKRKMELEGRMNLIVEELEPNLTQVTANTRYVLTRTIDGYNAGYQHLFHNSDTLSFNTGQQNSYPPLGKHSGTVCQCNGRFEKEVLSLVD